MAAENYFATSFNEARRLFHRACATARVRAAGFGTAHGMFGGAGGALVEVVRLGDLGAQRLVVLCGGDRLADALCCSGIEVGWLSEFANAAPPPGTAIVLVHNGAAPVTGGEPAPEAQEIPKWDSDLLTKVEARYAEYARERGIDHQGAPLEPGSERAANVAGFSTEILDDVAGELGSAREGRVIFLDIGVGLGPYGQVDVVPCHAAGSPGAQRARLWFGPDNPSAGDFEFRRHPDHLATGLMRRLATAEVTAVRLAFGTYSMMSVLETLADRQAEGTLPEARRLFYPEAAQWRRAVWQNGVIAIQRALRAVSRR